MDQLETLVIPTDTVKLGERTIELRGLGLAHITRIVRDHRQTVTDLYEKAVTGKLDANVADLALRLADEFTPLAALVIACGARSNNVAVAAELPVSVQAEALEKVIRLTIVGEGGLEKLMEIVVRAVMATASLTSLKTSQPG